MRQWRGELMHEGQLIASATAETVPALAGFLYAAMLLWDRRWGEWSCNLHGSHGDALGHVGEHSDVFFALAQLAGRCRPS